MIRSTHLALLLTLCLLGAERCHADATDALTLPAVFSDGMVLQSGEPVPVWGIASSEADVTVQFSGQKKTAGSGRKPFLIHNGSAMPGGLIWKG